MTWADTATYSQYQFGFTDLDTMKAWFRRCMTGLFRAGFVVREIKVNKRYTLIGASGQVAFIKEKAVSLNTWTALRQIPRR